MTKPRTMNKKSLATIAGIIVFFFLLVCLFVPEQAFGGKIVEAPDYAGYLGMSKEANDWNWAHPDDKTAWTGSMFSGMPTMMITGNVQKDGLRPVFNMINLTKFKPASVLLLSLIGAFLLLLVIGISPIVAAGGAVAVTLCSYNLQIIQVGHNTKMQALALFPWVLASVIFTYKKAFDDSGGWKKWLPATLLGAILFGFALAFQIKANHVQITWYLALVLFVYVIGLIVWICVSKQRLKTLWGRFLTASVLLLISGVAGIGTNASSLVPMWEYTTQTMRGGSELSGEEKNGLSLDYSTSWSYGWEELPNIMIANFNGGASKGALPPNSKTVALLKKSNLTTWRKESKKQPLYWGPQPDTAGPMYVGAITVFLFLLGLLVCEGKDRWWMMAAALLSIGLALGRNLMPLTRFFYSCVPFYNKFRAVSMSLVILQFILPMLGFLALDKILKGDVDKKAFMKKGLTAFAIVGGFCLIFSLFPGLAGDFRSPMDEGRSAQWVEALSADRRSLLRKDAFFSLILVSITYVLLLWSYRKKDPGKTRFIVAVAICALVTVNLFGVGKRFLNSEHFTSRREFNKTFTPREVDKMFQQDNDPYYRVADLTVNVFSDSKPSYFHKNIGGYSAAKLQRYDDLINWYLKKELSQVSGAVKNSGTFGEFQRNVGPIPILSMLNTKYFIYDENRAPLENMQTMGEVWLVDQGKTVSTPDEEIKALGKTNLWTTALLGPDFKNVSIPPRIDENDWISFISYAPNEVRYQYEIASDRAAVFSEIYYPFGWTAKIDGNTSVDIFRADWTLRGIILPAGKHELVMRMDPPSYRKGARLSLISSIFLYLLLALSAGALIISKVRK